MRTPQDKYDNDMAYRQLVSMLENLIHKAEFTPSELREACIFAHIRYSSYTMHPYKFLKENEEKVETALEVLKKFRVEE